MRNHLAIATLAIMVVAACVTYTYPFASPQAQPLKERTSMWKKVDDAIAKGLPKTAIEELKPIEAEALRDQAYPEAIKAIARRIVLEAQIEGGSPAERITRMKDAIARAPGEMRPTMHALLASWYWSYFLENRWQFAQRTETSNAPSDDFTTWDLKRLFDEIDAQFTAALADEATLRTIPIATYDQLLEKGTLPDAYRPTLYDFLAFSAIDFYAAGEQAGTQRQDAFEIDASSPALGSLQEFSAWVPKTLDTQSPKFKAIQLYQKLLAFHASDSDPSPLLDAELGRLQFAYANAVGEEKNSRTKAALRSFANTYATHELSSMARNRLAQILFGEQALVEAREVALQGKNAFPESVGGKLCHNLIETIDAKSISVLTERVWNEPFPVLRVRYRNVTKVYFRAVKADWAARFSVDRWRPDQLNEVDRKQLVKEPPVAEWSADLPDAEDYREAMHEVPSPKGLKPGYYLVLSSVRPDFREEDNSVSAIEVWVTRLALIVRQEWNAGRLTGFVLDNQTGDPIAGATVRTMYRDNRTRAMQDGPSTSTDQDGKFELPSENRNSFLIASHAGQTLATQSEFTTYTQSITTPSTRVVLFTDRSIYRPGQIVHVKGIAMIMDPNTNRYEVVPNAPFRILFRDINGKDIESVDVRSNDFGSFSRSFTSPRDRGTGIMSIAVENVIEGQAMIRVEEYKRPKFKVDIELPKEATKLGDTVSVSGKAMSYTGTPIQEGKVRYRVVRQVRWPDWFMFCYGWRIAPMMGQSQEIANGWTRTDSDGTFQIEFVAHPDRTIPESDQPIFTYAITADVTDSTGETRTGDGTVSVAYTALQAELSADDWQTHDREVKIRLRTLTPSGVAIGASGKVRAYALRAPETVLRSDILGERWVRQPRGRGRPVSRPPSRSTIAPDPSDFRNWALGDEIAQSEFATQDDGKTELSFSLPRGVYRFVLETQDRFGKPVQSELNVRVVDEKASDLGLKLPHVFSAPKFSLEPGETWKGLWGSGYTTARAYVEIEHRGKSLQKYWTKPGLTQVTIEQSVDESMRGGLTVRVTMVRDNRAYMESRTIDVPWSNKELSLRWERFRSKLEPGSKESWSLVIQGPKAKAASAEMVAAMYDASLDAFLPHGWPSQLAGFYRESSNVHSVFQNIAVGTQWLRGNFKSNLLQAEATYRRFPMDLRTLSHGVFLGRGGRMRGLSMEMSGRAPGAPASAALEGLAMESRAASPSDSFAMSDAVAKNSNAFELAAAQGGEGGGFEGGAGKGLKLDSVSPRKNLNETAFFLPQLRSDSDGIVKLEFTMPEALTTWRFLSFAHDTQLRSGGLVDQVVTAKDLMVQPNPPRFLREGDTIEFSVKVTNQATSVQSGRVALQLSDAITEASVDAEFGNVSNELTFEIPGQSSKSFRWRLTVPDGARPIIYKAVAATEKLSDGEQGMLPVLSNRILVTESLPLPIRGKSTREFEFTKLMDSANSQSLRSQSLTIQMTSQPAWYAVLALPYLMEFPHECSEQIFNRLYANALAKHIAQSDPKIERVFQIWRDMQPDALVSPLSKNQDVKSVMIEETPWLLDAAREAQSRRNVGVLFDTNRLESETATAMNKLAQMQRENGMWPWFPGGPDNEYLSLYIVTGFGRMRHLGVKFDESSALRALEQLDAWMHRMYDRIPSGDRNVKNNFASPTIALYLYGRSFFIADRPIAEEHQVSLRFWQQQVREHWLGLSRQSQAHIAIGMNRMGDKELPAAILKSLRENSVTDEEMGMFWRDAERSWWWYHAPIETQAMMIEALDEVSGDQAAVEECKVWLLKQKQTQDWKTTKATADAVYALLLRGEDWLEADELVSVKVGDMQIVPDKVEAGTGFFEQRFPGSEVRPEMGRVTVTKKDDGVSWGSMHWQYLEDIEKVTPYEGTPLKLEKKIYRRVLKETGPILEEIVGPIAVGDELVCRIVLRTDRDMEYIHLKDARGSGTEPVNVLSGYRFQDGLAYYESTRDTATHFFIDYLRKGNYVFEYTLRVQHAGSYPMGVATIQCMYAPEFNSHSDSTRLVVE